MNYFLKQYGLILLKLFLVVLFSYGVWRYFALQTEYNLLKLSVRLHTYEGSGEKQNFAAKSQEIRICSQIERNEIVKEMCKNLHVDRKGKIQFILDEKHKAAYCQIEKSGCSTIRLLMANMTAGGTLTGKDWPRVHSGGFLNKTGLKEVHFMDSKEAMQALRNYTKFTVVRNPLKRLISGYYDKVLSNNFLSKKEIIDRYHKTEYHKVKSSLHQYPLFPEYASFVKGLNNAHFNPQEQNCDICNIDYDYILKLETIEQELPQFLADVYNQGAYTLTIRNRQYSQMKSEIATEVTATQLEELTVLVPELHKDIVNYYRKGIDILGYTYNESSYISTCGNSNSSVAYCC